MKMVRVGIEAGLASSKHPTGVEHYARSLLAELLRLEHSQIEWFVYLPPGAETGAPIPERVNARYRPDVNTLVKVPWLVSSTWRDRLDVLFTFGHMLPSACRGKRVVTVYDTAFDRFADCYPPGDAECAHREVQRAVNGAAGVIVPSVATRQCLVDDYGCPPERIHLMLGGYRTVFQPASPASAQQTLPAPLVKLGIEGPYLLSVGRLDRRKNLERVIETYRSLLRDGVECGTLVIVGPADTGSAAVQERLASGAAPGERILRTGYLGDEHLVPLYQHATAFIYPSLAEGFGLPVLEAMACGAPTITSNVSSMPEVAGDSALLVDPTNTAAIAAGVKQVVTDASMREKLRRDGPRQASQFTWKASAERIAAALMVVAERA